MIGYLVSLLKNEMCEDVNCTKGYQIFLPSMVRAQILSTMSELFLEIFNEPMNNKISTISNNDLKITLTEIFDLVSEKIQSGGESFLEISFLCGGLISLTHIDEENSVDRKKMRTILISILTTLGLNFCWSDLNKTIDELSSNSIRSRKESRDNLFLMICGSHENHKKIFEIQNLFETTKYNQSSVYA